MEDEQVSILIPNYNGLRHLKVCLQSIDEQTHKEWEVIVADNGSSDGSVEYLQTNPKVKIIRNTVNLGFPKAVNQAAEQASGRYLLFLNNDTALDPRCLENMLKEFKQLSKKKDRVAGLAPKILFYEFPTIIDTVGTGINPNGTGFNIGAGQIDLGQFDFSAQVFGLCFAAAFVKRDIFEQVGPLAEDYFAYYEDIDWSYRANAQGYEFRTAPDAVVYHLHSATARKIMEYSEKRYLLGRNKLRTMIRNYQGMGLIQIARPIAASFLEIYNTVRHPLSRPPRVSLRELTVNIKILSDLLQTPKLLHQNILVNRDRKVGDSQIFKISEKWRAWLVDGTFHDSTHSPVVNLESLRKVLKVAAQTKKDNRLRNQWMAVKTLSDLIKNNGWHISPLDETTHTQKIGYHLKDFLATSQGNLWFVIKQDQSIVTDSFILDLLLSFRGRSKEEITSHLENQLRLITHSTPKEVELSINEVCEHCVSVLAHEFESWGLVSSGESN